MITATLPQTHLPTGAWDVDPGSSRVGFAIKQFGIAIVRGEFREFEGTIAIGDDLEASRASGTVSASSVDTGNDRRDAHLRSADFFGAEDHPELHFESKRIEAIDGETLLIVGELEMLGVTRELELEAEVIETGQRLGLKVRGALSRRDYGMEPTAALGLLNAVIAETVELELEVAAVKQGRLHEPPVMAQATIA